MFCRDVYDQTHELVAGDQVLFELPWMQIAFGKRYPEVPFSCFCLEAVWPKMQQPTRWVAALNLSDSAVFILPPHTLTDEFGYRHTIIEQAVVSLSLKRNVKSNDLATLSTLITRRLEEFNGTPVRR